MWTQYSINFFIYAYRSEQYRNAYWDILVILFPCLPNLLEKWNKTFPKKQEYMLASTTTTSVDRSRHHGLYNITPNIPIPHSCPQVLSAESCIPRDDIREWQFPSSALAIAWPPEQEWGDYFSISTKAVSCKLDSSIFYKRWDTRKFVVNLRDRGMALPREILCSPQKASVSPI